MMSGDDRCAFLGWTGHLATTALMPRFMAVMILSILPSTAPTIFLNQECYATTKDLVQSINTPVTKGTDHTPIMVPDTGDISGGHSPANVPNTRISGVLEFTPHTLLPATVAAHNTLQAMDAPITSHTMIWKGIDAPHPAVITSPTGVINTTPQTHASLTPATPTAQHKDLRPEKASNA